MPQKSLSESDTDIIETSTLKVKRRMRFIAIAIFLVVVCSTITYLYNLYNNKTSGRIGNSEKMVNIPEMNMLIYARKYEVGGEYLTGLYIAEIFKPWTEQKIADIDLMEGNFNIHDYYDEKVIISYTTRSTDFKEARYLAYVNIMTGEVVVISDKYSPNPGYGYMDIKDNTIVDAKGLLYYTEGNTLFSYDLNTFQKETVYQHEYDIYVLSLDEENIYLDQCSEDGPMPVSWDLSYKFADKQVHYTNEARFLPVFEPKSGNVAYIVNNSYMSGRKENDNLVIRNIKTDEVTSILKGKYLLLSEYSGFYSYNLFSSGYMFKLSYGECGTKFPNCQLYRETWTLDRSAAKDEKSTSNYKRVNRYKIGESSGEDIVKSFISIEIVFKDEVNTKYSGEEKYFSGYYMLYKAPTKSRNYETSTWVISLARSDESVNTPVFKLIPLSGFGGQDSNMETILLEVLDVKFVTKS